MRMLSALHRKLLRDLWRMRGQALAIALVVAAGITTLVMSVVTHDSLRQSQARLYQEQVFPDIWADLKRAPESLAQRIALLPGVAGVETAVTTVGKLALPGFDEPIEATLQSLPDDGSQPLHNRLHLLDGRLPAPFSHDEVLLSDAFAGHHGVRPGARLRATIHGRTQWFRVVGIASSPEYLQQSKPHAIFPDHAHYAILWVPRPALASALDMRGAFNRLTVRLAPGAHDPASRADVMAGIDHELARWGGLLSRDRDAQPSHRYLESELDQLRTLTTIFPAIFLGVAAFLVNVVFSRLIATQRGQVAILKAFGYRTVDVIIYYGLMAAVVALAGALLGTLAGLWLGRALADLYQETFRFPSLKLVLDPLAVLGGLGVAMLAAIGGGARAVLAAAREPVAQAMRPVPPERYGPTLAERLGLSRWLSQPARMVLRQIERRPWRAVLSITGLALAGAIIMLARFQLPTITYMIDQQYRLAEHQDIEVHFIEAMPMRALHELAAIPGVRHVEGLRSVPVKLMHDNRHYNGSIEGVPASGLLRRPVDNDLSNPRLPAEGLMLSAWLAGHLGVGVDDMVQVQVLDGKRRLLALPVRALITENLGARAYMDTTALNRALGDGERVSAALLTIDDAQERSVQQALDARPGIVSTDMRAHAIAGVHEMLARVTAPFTWMSIILGCIVNVGVVYTSARITLGERAHELASLRVLGFTRGETARIVLGEIAWLVLVSIPLSFGAGLLLCWLLVRGLQTEVFRVPIYMPPSGFALAAVITLCSALLSALVVLRLVNRLNMIEALKVHE